MSPSNRPSKPVRDAVDMEEARDTRRRRLLLVAVAGGLVAVLAGSAAAGAAGVPGFGWLPWAPRQTADSGEAGRGSMAAVQTFEITDATHVNGTVQYPHDPPAGGRHAPAWVNCGFYSRPVTTEQAVHSMEHGAVWITYRPDLPAAQVEALRRLGRGQRYVLVSPYPSLTADRPVVASAWGKQVRLSSATDPGLSAFIREFAAGPQTPEPGAPCSGGVGQPE